MIPFQALKVKPSAGAQPLCSQQLKVIFSSGWTQTDQMNPRCFRSTGLFLRLKHWWLISAALLHRSHWMANISFCSHGNVPPQLHCPIVTCFFLFLSISIRRHETPAAFNVMHLQQSGISWWIHSHTSINHSRTLTRCARPHSITIWIAALHRNTGGSSLYW